MAEQAGRQVPVTFEDVVIYFSPEEWALLAAWQKDLYCDVVEDNCKLLASLGALPLKPELLCRIERGEDPCVVRSAGQGDAWGSASSGESTMSWPESAVKREPKVEWSLRASPPWSPRVPHLDSLESLCPSLGQVELTNIRSLAQERPLEVGAKQEPELLICGECGRNFDDKGSLADHQATHEEQRGLFACSSCGKLFLYHLNLLAHKKQRAKAPLECATCGLRFCLKGDLLRHRLSHVAKDLYPCSVCGQAFQRKAHLLAHEVVEHADRAASECPECGEAVGGEVELARHRAVHREDSLGPQRQNLAQKSGHRCPDCGKSFSRRANFLAHQRMHTGDLPFACSDCDRAFATNIALVAHSKLHRRAGRKLSSREKLLQHQNRQPKEEEEEEVVRVKEEGEA